MLTDFTSKNIHNFECENCHFKCSKKGDYNRHILTSKHIILTQTNDFELKGSKTNYTCACGKEYMHASSLWNHKQKCALPTTQIEEPTPSQDDIQLPTIPINIIMELITQ